MLAQLCFLWNLYGNSFSAFSFLTIFFFFFVVLLAAYGILVPRVGIKTMAPALEAQSPNHWTTRGIPSLPFLTFWLWLSWCFLAYSCIPSGSAFIGTWHPPCVSVSFSLQFSSVQSLSHVQLFATPWIAAHQASLSITNSSLRRTIVGLRVCPTPVWPHLNLHLYYICKVSIFK